MREFKFRAWCLSSKRWLDPQSSQLSRYFIGYANPVMENIESKSIIIQQYTGLKDKKGEDIYEGDILKGYFFDTDYMGDILVICPVIWNDSTASFNVGCRYWTQKSIVVIGNIFENPDLIK